MVRLVLSALNPQVIRMHKRAPAPVAPVGKGPPSLHALQPGGPGRPLGDLDTMTFLAGAVALDRETLDSKDRKRFFQALEVFAPEPAPPRTLSRSNVLLARTGFDRLWQGPTLLSTPALDAAGMGIQWRPLSTPSLEALAGALALNGDAAAADAFDGFACAVIPRDGRPPVLATDPLGLFPLAYTLRGGTLFFSSHQTFLCSVLEEEARPRMQAVLEFLLVGHVLGDKTLLQGVDLIPPACRLVCEARGIRLAPYGRESASAESTPPRSPRAASERLFDHLVQKRDRYAELCDDPVLGFLSGGWDSRLLVGLFAGVGRIAETRTTQQRVRRGPLFLSEEAIAREVAALLRLKNRFFPPVYRDPSTLRARATRLDCATWFHDWAFRMADEIPQGRYLLLDGLLGDVLLRALFVDDALAAAERRGDRSAVQRILHRRLVHGFNTYTPGIGAWGAVLREDVLKAFTDRVWEDLGKELNASNHEDVTTRFLLRNRSRRGIAPLPCLVFGGRGDVHLPFCDPEFVRIALSVPLPWRRDGSIYHRLLERAHRGLSRIPSTNERNARRLGPYLVPDLPAETVRGKDERRQKRLASLSDCPFHALEGILSSAAAQALARKDTAALSPYLPLLEKIRMVEGLFKGRGTPAA